MKIKLQKSIYTLIILVLAIFLFPSSIYADNEAIGCAPGLGIFSQMFCDPNNTANPNDIAGGKLNVLISAMLGFLTVMAAIWFMWQLIQAGLNWMSSGGDKTKLEEARNRIYHSLLGLIIIVAAWALIGIVGKILGIVDILNPGQIFINISDSLRQ